MRKVLITGGAGFIGSHLVERLRRLDDWQIVIVDNLSNPSKSFRDDAMNKKVKFYREDIRNKESIADTVKREKIDTCIHLAAKTSVSDSIINPIETADVNVNGTLSILEACAKNEVRNVVFASSAAVYGEPKVLPIPEDHVLEPLSPYGASKVSGEAFVTSYRGSRKIKNAILLRFFNIYGEGQNPAYAGVITKFAERLAKGLPPIIYGTGEQSRDFVSVNDAVNAIVLASESDVPGVFNIGSGKPVSINELAQKMIKAFDLDLRPIYSDAREGEIMHSYADITKAERTLQFSPKGKLEADITQLIQTE